jgi:tetratricopeptide (TPR) repeat protein
MDWFFEFLSRLGEQLSEMPRRIARAFRRALYWPVQAAGAVVELLFHFIVWWWKDRRLVNFLLGLPAVAVFSVFGYFYVVGSTQSESNLGQTYLLAARKAQEAKLFNEAKLLFERGLALVPRDVNARYELANVSVQLKDFSRLTTLLNELAPEDRANHLPSHLLKANWYFELASEDESKFELGVKQLRYVLELDSRHPEAHATLGDICFQRQQWQEAISHYSVIQGEDPSRRMLVARAYEKSGNPEQAAIVAERSRTYFAQRIQRHPEEIESRLHLADACLFLKRHSEAVLALQEASKRSDDDRIRLMLATALLAWSDEIQQSSPEAMEQRFDLISASFLLNPSSLVALDRMLKLLGGTSEVATRGREFLLRNITEGKATAMCHLLLGSIAYEEKNAEEAKFHIDRAYKLMPQSGIIVNNFAYLLCFGEDSNPEEALRLMNLVIQREPNIAAYRDTRGQILVKMGRFSEAIEDLEDAIAMQPNSASSHETIAVAYERLNLTDLAAEHRQKSRKLRQDSSPRQ